MRVTRGQFACPSHRRSVLNNQIIESWLYPLSKITKNVLVRLIEEPQKSTVIAAIVIRGERLLPRCIDNAVTLIIKRRTANEPQMPSSVMMLASRKSSRASFVPGWGRLAFKAESKPTMPPLLFSFA